MAIEFYHMAESAPCRAVEMVARLVGARLNKHRVNLFQGEQLNENFIKLNPLHKIPFIIDNNGDGEQSFKLGESRAILAYLVNKYQPNNEHLYPRDADKRAKIDELLYYDIGTLSLTLGKLFYPIFLGKSNELNREDEEKFCNVLQYLEKHLQDNKCDFMTGNYLTIADCSIIATLSIATTCSYDLSKFNHLLAYIERCKAVIPDYAEINEVPCETMKKAIEARVQ